MDKDPHLSGQARRGYAPTHVDVRGILMFFGLLVIAGVVVHAGLWWWWRTLRQSTLASEEAARPRPTPGAADTFADRSEPRLQLAPAQELEAYLSRERTQLNDYGWLPGTTQFVRIPIERAMRLASEQGLPAWPALPGAALRSPLELQQERGARVPKPPPAP